MDSPANPSPKLPSQSAETSRQLMSQQLDRQMVASGEVIFPCLPSAIEEILQRLTHLFKSIGKQPSSAEYQQLKTLIVEKVTEGFQASPQARLRVQYSPDPQSPGHLNCKVVAQVLSLADQYQQWLQTRSTSLFGDSADAKVLAVAKSLGTPSQVRVLDVGAGTGRNSLPLARRGYRVDALELTSVLAEYLLKASVAQRLPINVIQGDILDPLLRLRSGYYHLAIASQLIPQFRDVDQVRLFFVKLCDGLQAGGMLLFNTFLAIEGYQPDQTVRELSQQTGSLILTPGELAAALEDLPVVLISDESVLDYERSHQPPETWPPTPWFETWAQGQEVFPPPIRSGIELRWILCQITA